MPSRIMFWAAVVVCASFYFHWTARGLEIAGQPEAALANSGALLLLVIPSFAMFLREVLRLLRR